VKKGTLKKKTRIRKGKNFEKKKARIKKGVRICFSQCAAESFTIFTALYELGS